MAKLSIERIRELIAVATESGAAEVEIEEKGIRIVVRQHTVPVVMASPYPVPPYLPQPQQGYQPQVVPPLQAQMPDAPTSVATPARPEAGGTTVSAPIVGTFYRRPSPDAAPFVQVGDTVSVGDTLCVIEAMKNMNEIESEVAGTVQQILVEDAEAVAYDQPLFVIS